MNLVNVLANTSPYCTRLIETSTGGGIPAGIGNLIHMGFLIIQIAVPILLIIWGMLDFAKGVMQSDEDKIKEGQKKFIQRVIAAVICFLIVTIVQLVVNVVGSVSADNTSGSTWTCAKCLISGNPSECQ